MQFHSTRRSFLGSSLGCIRGAADLLHVRAAHPARATGRFCKSKNRGMVGVSGSVSQNFQPCRELASDGIDWVSTAINLPANQVRAASRETGMLVHGLANMNHYGIRLAKLAKSHGKLLIGVDSTKQHYTISHSFSHKQNAGFAPLVSRRALDRQRTSSDSSEPPVPPAN